MESFGKRWLGKRDWRIAAIALAGALLALAFFAPRFLYWRLLYLSLPSTTSEVIRAQANLVQLADPFARFDQDINQVLHWRLLLPIIGHTLHLPPPVYFGLAHAGALVALAMCATVMLRHQMGAWTALGGVVLLATTSWYFVSIGWLGYFDSWLLVGLLAVVFARRTGPAAVAVLLTPWVDERLVLTLPLALLLRLSYRRRFFEQEQDADRFRAAAWLGLALAPWLGIRGLAYFLSTDAPTKNYFAGLIARQSEIPAAVYLQGIWHGLRLAWLPVFVWLWSEGRGNPRRGVTAVALLAVTFLVNLFIASDISRSMSVFIPVALLGFLLSAADVRARRAIVLLGALNLVLPAAHVSGPQIWPIENLVVETRQLRSPPPGLTPAPYVAKAAEFYRLRNFEDALRYIALALELDSHHGDARALRAMIFYQQRRFGEARPDADLAVARDPSNASYRNTRACVRAELGDLAGAIADFERALADAPPDWPTRAAAQASLEQLRTKLRASRN
ncbi:MAG: tetratricopeptide repeat protein [Verrucomicrobia bacterium]|nr:tetratricopeptide repeat protein [Verrucomicrobiota bacterium]